MNAKKIFLLVCFILCLHCTANAQDNVVENWWDNNMLIAEGYGFPKENAENPRRAQILARRAAMMDAYRQLAEQAKGIHITAESTIGSKILTGDIVEGKVDAVVKGAQILSEEFDEYNNCKVVMCVPVYGVTDSVANVAFKSVDKKDFPPPSGSKLVTGRYTGLIIDCGETDLKPVLTPVIRSANNIPIYSYNNLDYDKVVSKGMVSYAYREPTVENIPLNPSGEKSLPLSYTAIIKKKLLLLTTPNPESSRSRAGNNPLVIKATGMSDENSCPIISADDADRILSENQASHFLDDGAVVLTGNSIGGSMVAKSYRVGGLRA